MSFKIVAEGPSFDDLATTVSNFELKKGTKVRFEMDLNMPVAFLFNVAGIEHLFSIDGLDLKDVHGEGWSTAVVEAEADPAWLLGVIAFIKAHWVAIAIGGIVLYTLVSFLRMLVDIVPDSDFLKWIVLGVGCVLGYRLLRERAGKWTGKEET